MGPKGVAIVRKCPLMKQYLQIIDTSDWITI